MARPTLRKAVRRTALASSATDRSSWTALLAGLEWGWGNASTYRVWVQQASPDGHAGRQRLVVQLYAAEEVVAGVPTPMSRPLAATQRATSAAEIRTGFGLELIGFGPSRRAVTAVAWTEPGEPDLDFDGLRAFPGELARPTLSRIVLAEPSAQRLSA